MERKGAFEFPEYYNWPCFFTIQVNNDTRDKQLKLWQELICGYSEANKIHTWGVNELHSSELCANKTINRKLSKRDFDIVVDYLVKSGAAAYTTSAKDKLIVYYKSIQEYAAAIYSWAQNTGRMNSVESLVDIANSSENANEVFYKVPVEIIKGACEALQRERKAEVFYSEATDEYGVKFFYL